MGEMLLSILSPEMCRCRCLFLYIFGGLGSSQMEPMLFYIKTGNCGALFTVPLVSTCFEIPRIFWERACSRERRLSWVKDNAAKRREGEILTSSGIQALWHVQILGCGAATEVNITTKAAASLTVTSTTWHQGTASALSTAASFSSKGGGRPEASSWVSAPLSQASVASAAAVTGGLESADTIWVPETSVFPWEQRPRAALLWVPCDSLAESGRCSLILFLFSLSTWAENLKLS